jgi:hypothetical protein
MPAGGIHYALNGDTSIAYSIQGEGELDLIFVGGFVSHLEIVQELEEARAFTDRLGSFARAIFFDKRGMGLSDRGSGTYTVEAVAEDMNIVLDAVGCDRRPSSGSRRAARRPATSPPPIRSARAPSPSMAPTPAWRRLQTTRTGFRSTRFAS